MAYNKLSLAEKLHAKSKQVGNCLVWIGAKTAMGYGIIRINGTWKRAHRVVYELAHGEIGNDLVIMHSCDNPSCIKLDHLSLGTQKNNIDDMHMKGRANYKTCSAHPKAKLTEANVEQIRNRHISYCKTNGASALAREFGVSKQAVLAILHNITWRKLGENKK
jgi:hypothetical protein